MASPMKICMISRPPLKALTGKFPTTAHHILGRMRSTDLAIIKFHIHPGRISNPYLAYGLGILSAPFRFKGMKPDLVIAEDIESSIAAIMIKYMYNIPFVFNFIDDYSLIASYENRKLRYRLLEFFEREIPKIADLVIVVDPVKRDFCYHLGMPVEKVKVVPNGVDTQLFNPSNTDPNMQKRLGVKQREMVLFVGKMNTYYELDPIVEAIPSALKVCPNTVFVFVGDGNSRSQLEEKTRDMGMSNSVIFTGFRPREEIPHIINIADVCVFPLPDSSALAIFEYMACGKSVVLPEGGTSKMGIHEEIFPKDCVVSVENTSSGFFHGIVSLLRNRELAEATGRKAREHVVANHDWDQLADSFREVLETVKK